MATKPKEYMHPERRMIMSQLEAKRSKRRELEFQIKQVDIDIRALEAKFISVNGGV